MPWIPEEIRISFPEPPFETGKESIAWCEIPRDPGIAPPSLFCSPESAAKRLRELADEIDNNTSSAQTP